MLGAQKTVTIMREIPANEFTSSGSILPEDCSHSNCLEAWDNCTLSPADSEVTRLVMRRTEDRAWLVECSVFAKEDIPLRNGGLPGRRLGGSDRDRGETGEEETKEAGSGLAVRTPLVQSYSNTSQAPSGEEGGSEYCNKLHRENITKFYQDCCLDNQAGETRCALRDLLNSYEEQHRQVCPAIDKRLSAPSSISIGKRQF